MSLHELALAQGVKRSDTCKLFWGIYSHCLKFRIPEDLLEERRENHHQFWKKVKKGAKWTSIRPSLRDINADFRRELQTMIDDVIDSSEDDLVDVEYYYQTSDANVTFYFKDAAPVAALITNNPGFFHAYTAPASDVVAQRLQEVAGKKVEIRKKPFYGEFPYRMTMKWARSYEELDARVSTLAFEDSVYSLGDQRVLYVRTEDDFFLAKIALSDQIEKVTECLTVKEIEQAD
jgi:hypothetical protein